MAIGLSAPPCDRHAQPQRTIVLVPVLFFYLSLSSSINFLALLVSRMGLDKGELLLANTAELTD
ncbi:hypothetical protein M513_12922 [Trichuris suis]|uniref:Uncharacterized protein n=1 Tax=Trichuris suis TaxID=68888 RepID=A0A085LMM6_9BILA|nr:hypothetical protein M513_12922 [Trichuris suis]